MLTILLGDMTNCCSGVNGRPAESAGGSYLDLPTFLFSERKPF